MCSKNGLTSSLKSSKRVSSRVRASRRSPGWKHSSTSSSSSSFEIGMEASSSATSKNLWRWGYSTTARRDRASIDKTAGPLVISISEVIAGGLLVSTWELSAALEESEQLTELIGECNKQSVGQERSCEEWGEERSCEELEDIFSDEERSCEEWEDIFSDFSRDIWKKTLKWEPQSSNRIWLFDLLGQIGPSSHNGVDHYLHIIEWGPIWDHQLQQESWRFQDIVFKKSCIHIA